MATVRHPRTMATPTDLATLLSQPPAGLAHLVLLHSLQREFRWLFLVELALGLLACACVLPILVIIQLTGEGGSGPSVLDDLTGRMWRWSRRLELRGIAPDRSQQFSVLAAPTNAEEAERLVGSVLSWADAHGLVVVEHPAPHAPPSVWFGGQPLLSPPDSRDLEGALDAWSGLGGRVLAGSGADGPRFHLVFPESRPGRLGAFLLLLVETPLRFYHEAGQTLLRDRYLECKGVSAEIHLNLDGAGLRIDRVRGSARTPLHLLNRAEFLGIAWAPVLVLDGEPGLGPARLRLRARERSVDLHQIRDPALGCALRDLLFAATRRLWAAPGPSGRPAHCPYCATLFTFATGATCPSCGAPPLSFHGLADEKVAPVMPKATRRLSDSD